MIGLIYLGGFGALVTAFTVWAVSSSAHGRVFGALRAFSIAWLALAVSRVLSLLVLSGEHPDCFPEDLVDGIKMHLFLRPPTCRMDASVMEPLAPFFVVMAAWSLPLLAGIAAIITIYRLASGRGEPQKD